MRDTYLSVINVLFFSLSLFVAIAMFVTCIWSDSDRSGAPILKRTHVSSPIATNTFIRSMEKI